MRGGSDVRQIIEAAEAQLRFLPAYNPDIKPTEVAFAKLKALLHTAAARTVPDLWATIRNASTRFKLTIAEITSLRLATTPTI